jgi:hypothetical protein
MLGTQTPSARPDSSGTRVRAEISDWEMRRSSRGKQYTSYKIRCTTLVGSRTTWRRFSDFVMLNRQLEAKGLDVLVLPRKRLFTRSTAVSVVRERQQLLEKALNGALRKGCPSVLAEFLGIAGGFEADNVLAPACEDDSYELKSTGDDEISVVSDATQGVDDSDIFISDIDAACTAAEPATAATEVARLREALDAARRDAAELRARLERVKAADGETAQRVRLTVDLTVATNGSVASARVVAVESLSAEDHSAECGPSKREGASSPVATESAPRKQDMVEVAFEYGRLSEYCERNPLKSAVDAEAEWEKEKAGFEGRPHGRSRKVPVVPRSSQRHARCGLLEPPPAPTSASSAPLDVAATASNRPVVGPEAAAKSPYTGKWWYEHRTSLLFAGCFMAWALMMVLSWVVLPALRSDQDPRMKIFYRYSKLGRWWYGPPPTLAELLEQEKRTQSRIAA